MDGWIDIWIDVWMNLEHAISFQVNLYSVDGTLKYSTDCAPNNGYFLLPIYDQV